MSWITHCSLHSTYNGECGVCIAWALFASADALDASESPRESCCDMHNTHCEPPGDLCCYDCTEAGHPEHPAGVRCVLDSVTLDAPESPTH